MKRLALALILGLWASSAWAQRVLPPENTINCAFNTSPPTVLSGQMVMIQCDAQGRLILSPSGGGTIVEGNVSNATSGVATTSTNVPNVSYNYAWNGTTWDQVKSKAASTAAVATDTSVVVQLNPLSPGIILPGPQNPAGSIPTVSAGFTYTHITTATTTAAIKTGVGVLHTVCVNTLGTVASAITVDDALTATTPTIAVINSLTLLGCQTYDVAFSIGLTIVTTGTVAPDVTVTWR